MTSHPTSDPAPADPVSHDEHTAANRAVIAEFARIMYEERDPASAFGRFVAPDFIQHNPGLPDGSAAAVAFLAPMYGAPDARFDVQRILIDGDLAAVHLRAQPPGRPPIAIADFYRLEDGLIVEHWDAIQPVPQESANDHPMF